jgi:hypothetical protein
MPEKESHTSGWHLAIGILPFIRMPMKGGSVPCEHSEACQLCNWTPHILNVARRGTYAKWLTAVLHFRNRVSSMLTWNGTDTDGETDHN